MAASASGDTHSNTNAATASQRCGGDALSPPREMIKPSVVELTKEVRKNILCTVEGCGKILPNTPALNMHLVKSHRVKDGVVNWTVRKDMKGSQKLYCCPIEGCPRGPNRPFSQFSLVKQHFMKMHAEKKHKCSKCDNGYSTEWDLRRHVEHCGKTYHCTCGCPYASRTSLLSHVYRTGHEVPSEHRYPPVKKRKMDKLVSGAAKVKANEPKYQILSAEVVLVNVPVMQLAHLPVLLPSAESGGSLRSVVLAVDSQGSRGAPHFLSQSLVAAATPHLDARTLGFKDGAGGRVKSEPDGSAGNLGVQRGRSSTSTDIQTDVSYLARGGGVGEGACLMAESSVSSCSQTDISVSAQVLLPVSVETQTFPSKAKVISTIGAQTDPHSLSPLPCVSSSSSTSSSSPSSTRQTQTAYRAEERAQMDRAIASHLFDCDSLSVSTQTVVAAPTEAPFRPYHHDDPLAVVLDDDEEKSPAGMCFGAQTDELQSSGGGGGGVADNQTQTQLFNDLENILSDSMAGDQGLADWLGGADAPLESLDIQTQTDFLLLDGLGQGGEGAAGRGQSDLELEMFDTQTQTDLNLFLTSNETQTINMEDLLSADLAWGMEAHFNSVETQTDLDVLRGGAAGHTPLASILRQSGFSMSTESSDTEMQTDLPSPPLPPPPHQSDPTRLLSSAETQTAAGSWECLGNLFLTSIETQTVVGDGHGRPVS